MARIRTIKPDFWEHEGIGCLTPAARLLYIATWNLADDEGLLRWTPTVIKANVFLYDDTLDIPAVTALMKELEDRHYVHPYRGGTAQQRLGWVVNFRKHQRINRPQPSRLPPPSIHNIDVLARYRERDENTCGICGEAMNAFVGGGPEEYKSSLDHITPRAHGGTDYPSNMRLAHLSCNKRRGATPDPDDDPDGVNPAVNRSLNEAVSYSRGHSLNDSRNGSLTDSLNGSLNGSHTEGEGEGEREREVEGDSRARRDTPPRCKRHAHLDPDDPGPACVGCRSVRIRRESASARASAIAREQAHQARIAAQVAARRPEPVPVSPDASRAAFDALAAARARKRAVS